MPRAPSTSCAAKPARAKTRRDGTHYLRIVDIYSQIYKKNKPITLSPESDSCQAECSDVGVQANRLRHEGGAGTRRRRRRAAKLDEIAAATDAPRSVLEQVMPALRSGGIVRSVRGPGGGYTLNRPPEEITLERVVRLFQGQLAPIGYATRSHPDNAPRARRGHAAARLGGSPRRDDRDPGEDVRRPRPSGKDEDEELLVIPDEELDRLYGCRSQSSRGRVTASRASFARAGSARRRTR